MAEAVRRDDLLDPGLPGISLDDLPDHVLRELIAFKRKKEVVVVRVPD